MAIFKHVHKGPRYENRAGCTDRQDVRRLMEYLMRSSAHGKTVWNDFQNETPAGITEEIMALNRAELKYKAYHFMLSFPAGERSQWESNLDKVLLDFAQRFKVHRMVWASHEDKDNFHVHGCVFAQTIRGKKLRLETKVGDKVLPVAASLRHMAEDWEDRLGTRKTGRSPTIGIQLAKDTLEMAQREHAEGNSPTPVPAKVRLRAAVEHIVAVSRSFSEMEANSHAAGIEVRFTEHPNGTGISFADGSISLRGREAGFTFQTLTQKFNEPNPTIVRVRPDPSLAARNCPRSRRPVTPRTSKADQGPRINLGDPTVGNRSELGIYRDVEKTLRTLNRVSQQGGLMAFLQFLTTALSTISRSADTPQRTPWRPRPTL
jgi:Relaxase/Mobilisation nuclease domain